MALIVSLPYPWLREQVAELSAPIGDALEIVDWPVRGDAPPRPRLDLVVLPFHSTAADVPEPYVSTAAIAASLAAAEHIGIVQTESIGYEGLPELLPPGTVLCNAAGVMESQTAELAVALLLALQRDLPSFARAHSWQNHRTPGVAGKRVVLLGYGGIGAAIHRRLAGFDAEVIAVARTARTTPDGTVVHPLSALRALAASADALVVTLPLSDNTAGLVGEELLAALPDGASVVNVGRGQVVDTAALVTEVATGRLIAALDVTDPEPLPDGHPLWSLPGALITPHVGGNTDRMPVSIARLVASQIRGLREKTRPINPVAIAGTQTGPVS